MAYIKRDNDNILYSAKNFEGAIKSSLTVNEIEYMSWGEGEALPLIDNLKIEAFEDKKNKVIQLETLLNLTVTTTSGKEFYVDEKSMTHINTALEIARDYNLTETIWKLTENNEPREQTVTIDELKEARLLGFTKFGQTKGIGE